MHFSEKSIYNISLPVIWFVICLCLCFFAKANTCFSLLLASCSVLFCLTFFSLSFLNITLDIYSSCGKYERSIYLCNSYKYERSIYSSCGNVIFLLTCCIIISFFNIFFLVQISNTIVYAHGLL